MKNTNCANFCRVLTYQRVPTKLRAWHLCPNVHWQHGSCSYLSNKCRVRIGLATWHCNIVWLADNFYTRDMNTKDQPMQTFSLSRCIFTAVWWWSSWPFVNSCRFTWPFLLDFLSAFTCLKDTSSTTFSFLMGETLASFTGSWILSITGETFADGLSLKFT